MLVTLIAAGVAVVWSLVALRQLSSSIAHDGTRQLERARVAFDSIRARTIDNLRAHCRILVEDPRLKSTLATEGVDAATVADILADLGELRRTGFLVVLSPEGRVFAQTGADALRGLDLSGSSPVRKAQATLETEVGSWVIDGKVMDFAIGAVRFARTPVAYMVVGQALDQGLVKAVADQTGVGVAIALGATLTLSSSPDDTSTTALATAARHGGSFEGRRFEIGGQIQIATIADLEDAGAPRPRLVLVQSLRARAATFLVVRWLIYGPPILVLLCMMFAMTTMTASHRFIVMRQS
jgi:hypothetical protein